MGRGFRLHRRPPQLVEALGICVWGVCAPPFEDTVVVSDLVSDDLIEAATALGPADAEMRLPTDNRRLPNTPPIADGRNRFGSKRPHKFWRDEQARASPPASSTMDGPGKWGIRPIGDQLQSMHFARIEFTRPNPRGIVGTADQQMSLSVSELRHRASSGAFPCVGHIPLRGNGGLEKSGSNSQNSSHE